MVYLLPIPGVPWGLQHRRRLPASLAQRRARKIHRHLFPVGAVEVPNAPRHSLAGAD